MASAQTWAKRVAAWRVSGEAADTFSAGRGFSPSTLRWWASRLGRDARGLVRVVTPSAPKVVPRDATIDLEVGGVRVVVRAGFDRALLRDVLDVLRETRTS